MSRTKTSGDGGDGAVFGSFAAVAAALMMLDMDGRRRTNVPSFYRALLPFLFLFLYRVLARSFSAADRSSFGRMIFVVERTVVVTADYDSLVVESVEQQL